MKRIKKESGIVTLVVVVLGLCVWRATSSMEPWYLLDYTGILGFGFTLVTAWYAFFIKRDVQNLYMLIQRLPEQLADLETIASELELHYHFQKDSTPKIRDLVARIYAICDNIAHLIQGQDSILGLNKVIQTCRMIHTERFNPDSIRIPPGKSMLSGDDVSDLHGDLMLLIHSLKQKNKNMEKVIT